MAFRQPDPQQPRIVQTTRQFNDEDRKNNEQTFMQKYEAKQINLIFIHILISILISV